MINAINNGEYKTANELYYNNYNALSDNKAVIDAIQAQVDAVRKAYDDGSMDYDTAMDKLDDISDLPMSYETSLSEVRSEIRELESSADYLKQGDEYLKKKEYSNAIYYYDEVLEKDTANYKRLRSKGQRLLMVFVRTILMRQKKNLIMASINMQFQTFKML